MGHADTALHDQIVAVGMGALGSYGLAAVGMARGAVCGAVTLDMGLLQLGRERDLRIAPWVKQTPPCTTTLSQGWEHLRRTHLRRLGFLLVGPEDKASASSESLASFRCM